MELTIFTPTYNRVNLLKKLYKSLKKQTNNRTPILNRNKSIRTSKYKNKRHKNKRKPNKYTRKRK